MIEVIHIASLPSAVGDSSGGGSSAAGQTGKGGVTLVDLSSITQVVVVNSESDVNSYLRAGWVILAAGGGHDDDGFPEILTMLGRAGD